jgi:hypothetical protein
MFKTLFSRVALLSVSSGAALILSVTGCGSSSGGSATGTGGHGGAGGAGGAHDGGAGSGGAGGHDAAMDQTADTAAGMVNFTFTTDTEGFMIDNFASPTNLGSAVTDGGAGPTAAFDGSTGMPAPGSLLINATFTDYNQVLIVRQLYQSGLPLNLTGKILSAQIRFNGPAGTDGGAADGGSSGSSTFVGLVHLYALSTPDTVSYFAAEGPSITMTDHNWHALSFDMANPGFAAPGFQPTQIVQLGVQFATPSPAAPDAAAPAFGAPQSISVNFDTLVSN